MEPTLLKHQEEALSFGLDNDYSFGVFYDMGLGKTLIALEVFKQIRKVNPRAPMFFISNKTTIYNSIISDIQKFTDFTYWNVHDQIPKKPVDIILANPESISMSKKMGETFLRIASIFHGLIVIDESQCLKNPSSKISKIMLNNSHLWQYRMVMSGTPAPNNESEYWAQLKFLGYEDNIFKSYSAFKASFFKLVRGKEEITGCYNQEQYLASGFKMQVIEEKKKQFMDLIAKKCIFRKKEDCLNLPEKTFINKYVDMNEDESYHYNNIFKIMTTEIQGSVITADMALAKIMKLRQITSGFIYSEESDMKLISETPTKYQALVDTLDEIGDHQVMIWGQFKKEIDYIHSRLNADGYDTAKIHGDVKDEERNLILNDFKSGNKKYIICHPKTCGTGITCVNATYQIWFSLSYSYEQYFQALDRIHRIGQKNACTYINLISKKTIDEDILNILNNKHNASEIVFKYVQDKQKIIN